MRGAWTVGYALLSTAAESDGNAQCFCSDNNEDLDFQSNTLYASNQSIGLDNSINSGQNDNNRRR